LRGISQKAKRLQCAASSGKIPSIWADQLSNNRGADLKGKIGDNAVLRIEMVHPNVRGAEYFTIWPVDETHTWIATFGAPVEEKGRTRAVVPPTQKKRPDGNVPTAVKKQKVTVFPWLISESNRSSTTHRNPKKHPNTKVRKAEKAEKQSTTKKALKTKKQCV